MQSRRSVRRPLHLSQCQWLTIWPTSMRASTSPSMPLSRQRALPQPRHGTQAQPMLPASTSLTQTATNSRSVQASTQPMDRRMFRPDPARSAVSPAHSTAVPSFTLPRLPTMPPLPEKGSLSRQRITQMLLPPRLQTSSARLTRAITTSSPEPSATSAQTTAAST